MTLSSGGQVQAQAGQQRLESRGDWDFMGFIIDVLMFFEWFRMKKMDEHGYLVGGFDILEHEFYDFPFSWE